MRINPKHDGTRWVTVVIWALLGLAVALRTAQFLGFVEMWHDELALARNVADRDLVGLLTRPLAHHQVAPAGFVALLEVGSLILGVNEVGLRFGPWLFGVASVFLFWRIARRYVEGFPLLMAVAFFTASPALVWYGSSVKPYGVDVAVSLLLAWLALRYLDRPDASAWGAVAGGLGGAALLVSFPAVPTAAVLGVVLAIAWWRRSPRSSIRPLAALEAGWAAGAAAAGWNALRLLDPATEAFMDEFWAADFPTLTEPLAAAGWTGRRLYGVFEHFMVFEPPDALPVRILLWLILVLAVGGLYVGFRRDRIRWAVLLAPGVAGLAAGFVQLLPFDQRLGLHAGWPFLILAALGLSGIEALTSGRWRLAPRALAVVAPLPLLLFVLLVARPPYEPSAVRPVLEELAVRHQPGDRIYVYTQGRHDMAWYGRSAGLERWVQGDRHYQDPRGYLREVDVLRGSRRAWFFWVRLDRDEPAWIRSYLATIGRELERVPKDGFDGAGAVLYDLSDPERLATVTASDFPPPELPPRGQE